jgi:hypothetical protein
MEERLAKQILAGFSDSRFNPAHLAWSVKLGINATIDKHLKEFFYYYQTFRNQDADANDAAWLGEKVMNQLQNPDYDGLSATPPIGTRIVWAEDLA